MEIKVLAYHPDDYYAIERREYDLFVMKHQNPEVMSKAFTKGPGYSIFIDGVLIACGGIYLLWKGVGEAWVIGSVHMEKYPLACTRIILQHMHFIMNALHLERVQLNVLKSFKNAQRWAEILGFHEEGEMKKFYAGEDYVRYALVVEGVIQWRQQHSQ